MAVKSGARVRDALLDTVLGRGKTLGRNRRLGIYDTAGVRRYWVPLSNVQVKGDKVLISNIPALVVDESFIVGWMQIDDEHDNMLVKFDIDLKRHALVIGEVLSIMDLTLTID